MSNQDQTDQSGNLQVYYKTLFYAFHSPIGKNNNNNNPTKNPCYILLNHYLGYYRETQILDTLEVQELYNHNATIPNSSHSSTEF